MPTPSIQTLRADAQQVLNLDSISAVRSVVAATLANANAGTPLNPNLTTQQLWNEFYQIVTQPKSDIESIIANQLMKFLYAPPAPGGAGADKQVIFNDGGVLAGDPQFLWNKTTNLLTVTGSATITGDLTVDSGTLRVNSSNDRVGVGTNSPTSKLHVFGSGTNTSLTISDVGANYNIVLGTQTADIAQLAVFNTTIASGSKDFWLTASSHTFNTWTGSAYSSRFVIASDGVATWSNVGGVAGTAMTLNATGLGVGASPTQPLTVRSSAAAIGMFHSTNVNGPYVIFQNSTGNFGDIGSELAITGGGSAGNLTLNSRSTSNLCFAVSDSVKMRIDSSGNIGIGVTPSAWGTNKAIEGGISGGKTGALMFGGDGSSWLINNAIVAASTTYKATAAASYYYQNGGQHIWSNAPSGTAGNAITFTQAMTLDASGNLLVGTTSSLPSFANGRIEVLAAASSYCIVADATATSAAAIGVRGNDSTVAASFYNASTGGTVGSIVINSGGVSYNTTSDYRLKESVKPISGGLARVNALKPSIYNWKSNGSTGEGFIAHELAEVVPFAVSGEKDAVNADGTIKSQGIDMSRVVPILVAAIQELTARVQTLEAR